MSALSSKAGAKGSFETFVDDDRRHATIVIKGAAAGPDVAQTLCSMYLGRPELTGYDLLFDLREYTGDVVAEDLKPLVEIYAGVRVPAADDTRTAFSTTDPNFGFWAEAMTFQFPGREHRAFAKHEDAVAFLDRIRPAA